MECTVTTLPCLHNREGHCFVPVHFACHVNVNCSNKPILFCTVVNSVVTSLCLIVMQVAHSARETCEPVALNPLYSSDFVHGLSEVRHNTVYSSWWCKHRPTLFFVSFSLDVMACFSSSSLFSCRKGCCVYRAVRVFRLYSDYCSNCRAFQRGYSYKKLDSRFG